MEAAPEADKRRLEQVEYHDTQSTSLTAEGRAEGGCCAPAAAILSGRTKCRSEKNGAALEALVVHHGAIAGPGTDVSPTMV